MGLKHAAGASGGYTPDYVMAVVESAGRTAFMLPATGCRPAQIKSCWPDAPDDEWFAYDANDPAPVKMRPTMAQMNEFNLVFNDWLPLMRELLYRRAVVYRMLRYPDTERPVYNWIRLGEKLKTDRRTAKRLYVEGIQHLTDRLNLAAHPS